MTNETTSDRMSRFVGWFAWFAQLEYDEKLSYCTNAPATRLSPRSRFNDEYWTSKARFKPILNLVTSSPGDAALGVSAGSCRWDVGQGHAKVWRAKMW